MGPFLPKNIEIFWQKMAQNFLEALMKNRPTFLSQEFSFVKAAKGIMEKY